MRSHGDTTWAQIILIIGAFILFVFAALEILSSGRNAAQPRGQRHPTEQAGR